MKIVIDLKAQTIEVPKDLKVAYESQLKYNKSLGKENFSILSLVDTTGFKVTTKVVSTVVGDKTKQADIDKYMEENVKDSNSVLYDEYIKLRDGKYKNKKGIVTKTSFLTTKKWFYEKFPNLKPLVK